MPRSRLPTLRMRSHRARAGAVRQAPAPSDAPTCAETTEGRMRRIIAEHYPFLWRSLRRLGVADAVLEDAGQQVLLVMARRLAEIRVSAERPFLFSAAVRVAADSRRSARRRRRSPSPMPSTTSRPRLPPPRT